MCPWRNWIAHLIPNQKVVGSIPIGHTIETKDLYKRPLEQRKRSGISLEIRTSKEVLFSILKIKVSRKRPLSYLLSLELSLFPFDYCGQTIAAVFCRKDDLRCFQFKLSCLGKFRGRSSTHTLLEVSDRKRCNRGHFLCILPCLLIQFRIRDASGRNPQFVCLPVKSSFRNI